MEFAKGSSAAKVYRLLYERRRASKQMVANELGLSLPTVSKALAALAGAGLVTQTTTFASTGGRPPMAHELVTTARYGVGVEMVADEVRLAAVDLYGNVLAMRQEPLPFRREASYFDQVARMVSKLVANLSGPQEALLGVTFAIQGIVDQTGRLGFGGLLGTNDGGIRLEDFSQRLPYRLRLVHDAEAAAYAELWRHRELPSFAYLSLNDHLGSALVLDGRLLQGGPLGAGVAEHMVLHPNGAPCYCGNRGCAETTLGAAALEGQAGLPVKTFFERVRSGDRRCTAVWHRYLDDLALLIHNVRMVVCCDVVIGGRLAAHLSEADLRALRTAAHDHGALAATPFRLVRGHYGADATVTGAGLLLVEEFLSATMSPYA